MAALRASLRALARPQRCASQCQAGIIIVASWNFQPSCERAGGMFARAVESPTRCEEQLTAVNKFPSGTRN
eukprot:2546148-Pyramimonas_sp.AAC.1